MTPRVLINGIDIYALGYINQIPAVSEQKTFGRDKIIQNDYSLTVKNFDDFFSVNNPRSAFLDTEWRFSPVEVWDDQGDLIWKGVLLDIERDHVSKTATLTTRNSLAGFWNQRIEYQSLAFETPSTAAKNLMDAYGFTDYDPPTITRSDAVYAAASVKIFCNFNASDETTLQNALEKIAEAGAADCWSHNNILYFRAWEKFAGNTKQSLTISDLLTAPKVASGIGNLINDYSNFYDAATTAVEDSTQNNIGQSSRTKFGTFSLPNLSGTSLGGSQIRFETSAAAIWVGEQYIKRCHQNLSNSNVRPLDIMASSIGYNSPIWVDLQSVFKFTFAEEGWTDKLFEIFEFTKDPQNHRIDIIAYEVVL